MKIDKNHIDFENEFFTKKSIQYSKSKEDVWLEMESKLNENQNGKVLKVNFITYLKYGIAAVLIIGLGLVSFMRFYSQNIYCPNGQHSIVYLPDGSKVTLNANSSIVYNPYWWKFSRKLDFSGEAFFEVKKGKKFEVISEKGTTAVLGTSFNIYSRKDEYRVYCISGKVKVKTLKNESMVLEKNDYTVVNQLDKLIKKEVENNNQNAIAWINNEFVFTSVPLILIYEEIERQFDIVIEGKENLTGISSFNSKRGSSPEEIINLAGKPFGIKCIKVSDKKFIVEQN